jgi:hypothetical protein
MLDAEIAFSGGRFLTHMHRPEFGPERMFIPRDALTQSLIRSP